MTKVLITGHCGFIGHHLVETFKKAGGVEIVGFDIKNGQDVRQRHYVLPEADWCFHLAALTDARSGDVEAMMKTNVLGTLHVLKQFGEHTIFTSSSAVNYPETPYAISKLTCEHLCKVYGARVVRLCNIFGEGGHGVINKFKAAEVLEIAGIGDQVRTYAPVEDAVMALIEAPNNPKGSVEILHGIDKTVLDIADQFPDKARRRVPRELTDILDGRQICP